MLRRLPIALGLLVLLAWLLGVGLVYVREGGVPGTEPAAGLPDGATWDDVARAWQAGVSRGVGGAWIFRHGYVQHWHTSFAEGERPAEDDRVRYRFIVRREALCRERASFPLSVCMSRNAPGQVKEIRLAVTRQDSPDIGDEDAWTRVGRAAAEDRGGWATAILRRAEVPADSTMYRITEVERDGTTWWVARSMPTHESWVGRVYDAVAWRPFFRWLP